VAVARTPDRRLRRVSPWPFDYELLPASPPERAVLALCMRSTPLVGSSGCLTPHSDTSPRVLRSPRRRLVEDAPTRGAGSFATAQLTAVGGSPRPDPDLTPPPPPPPTAEDAERVARGLLEKGHRQRAVQVLREALDRHPEARGPRRLLAMTLAREGGFEPAVETMFLSCLEKEPEDVEVRHALASYYRRAGLSARAILQLRLVLSADPGHAGAWRDLGELEAGETRRTR
jgi:hypothetical protein